MKTTTFYTKNKTEVDLRHKKFKSLVNMSAKEMKQWKKEPCSKAASIHRLEVINRVTRLLEKPKTLWNHKDFVDSAKVISYLSRATAIKDSVKPASKLCRRGKNYYALKNWAFDRDKVKRRNPHEIPISSPEEWERKIVSRLDLLLDEKVTLRILSNMSAALHDAGFKYKELSGTLKKSTNLRKSLTTQIIYHNYLFQFNPLNQPLSDNEKIKLAETKIGHNHNEEHMVMELEMEFENNEPTMEIEFNIFDVLNVLGDYIRLSINYKLLLREIK